VYFANGQTDRTLVPYECMTMTVMTENKLETNQQEQQQQQVESDI
jgi:hypothetical protein